MWGQSSGLNLTSSSYLEGPTVDALLGFAVRNLGDSDGDGAAEFAVGAHGANAFNGMVLVFEGETGTTNIYERWNVSGSGGEYFGYSLSGGKSITGSSDHDLAVGAPVWSGSNGSVYIYSGIGNATYVTAPSVTMRPTSQTIEQFGVSHDMVGDLNNDGTQDFVVGANAYNNFDGRLYMWPYGNLSTSDPLVMDINTTGLAESFGWRVVALGDVNQDGYGDFAATLASGINGTFTPGSVRAYYGRQYIQPQDVRVFVDTTQVFVQNGTLFASVTPTGFHGALQAYIDANPGAANATGIIRAPVSFSFSGGGKLAVSDISIRYSYVGPPPNVRVTAPAEGRSLLIAWDLHVTDATVFSVWSNKTGSAALVGTVSFPRTSFLDTNLTDGQRYYYWVTESDSSAGLESGPSAVASGVPFDTVAPEVPRNFSVTPFNANHSAWMVWSPNDDDIAAYEVMRQALGEPGFSVVGTIVHPGNSFLDTPLEEEITYNYTIRAVDPAGLRSGMTTAQTVALPDTVPPPAVQNVRALTAASGIAVDVSWDANTQDTVNYAIYLAVSNGTAGMADMGRSTGTTFTITNLARDTTYWVAVKAIDKVSHLSPFSNVFEVTTVDTLAPSPPVLTGISVPAEGNQIRLNWTASEDDIAGFRVFANTGGSWLQVTTFAGAARTGVIDNLTDGTPYALRMVAFDQGDRLSGDSNVLSATPRDSLRPAAPTGLTVTPLATGSSLTISWVGSPDDDVVHYELYFLDSTASGGFSLVATLNATQRNFTHLGLKNGVTYSYELRAVDEVPNQSPPSSREVGVPRDTVPPAAPRLDALPARTNHVTLQISGTSEEGLEVQVFLNGAQRQRVTAGVAGRFTVTLSLAQGDNTIMARAVDLDPSVEPGYKTGPDSAALHVILDTADPAVGSATPPDGSSGIPVAQRLTIAFSEAVDPASVVITLKDSSGAVVPGNVSIDSSAITATFSPSSPLKHGERYTLTVNATDAAGNEMPATTISFTTIPPEGQGGGGLPGPSAAAAALAMAGVAAMLAFGRRRRL